MKNTVWKRAQQGLFLGATAAAVLLVWLGFRLVPESTPVARGATHAYLRGCIECHGQPGDAFPDDSALECAGVRFELTHPRYEGECRDLLAYFGAVRLKRTCKKRAKSQHANRLLQGNALRVNTVAFNAMANWVRVDFKTRVHSRDIFRDTLAMTSHY